MGANYDAEHAVLFDIPAPTFNEFGIYYFVFGLFIILAVVMYYFIVVADPLPQYDIESLQEDERGEQKPKSELGP